MRKLTYHKVAYLFSRELKPAIEIDPGEDLLIETLDARGGRSEVGQDSYTPPPPVPSEKANPVTGPVYIRGAKPGATLRVEVKSINPCEWGYISTHPTEGILRDWIEESIARAVRVHEDRVYYNEEITFPSRPMIGTIGVAPQKGGVASIRPGIHGGNMDCNDIRENSVVYLPVFTEGALFALGDVHAFMGDIEASCGGIDISADVTVRIDLIEKDAIDRPMVETDEHLVFVYNAGTLKRAIRGVVEEAVNYLSSKLKMPREEAFMLVSSAGDVMMCQACDMPVDAVTRLRIPKAVFPASTSIP